MEIGVLIDEEFFPYLDALWLEKVMARVLSCEKAPQNVEVGLVITSQDKIKELNKTYLKEDHPTDVLAFAMGGGETPFAKEVKDATFVFPSDGIWHLGEVIISYPQAVIQGEEQDHSVKKELVILMIHGILHLLGYDHDVVGRESKMRARETEILRMIEGELL